MFSHLTSCMVYQFTEKIDDQYLILQYLSIRDRETSDQFTDIIKKKLKTRKLNLTKEKVTFYWTEQIVVTKHTLLFLIL